MERLTRLRLISLVVSLLNIVISIYGITKGEYVFWLVIIFSIVLVFYTFKVVHIIKGIKPDSVKELMTTLYTKTVYFVIGCTYFVLYMIIYTKYGISLQ